ncbi:hypothetical protein [Streptomyces sp. NPDC050535]|uniref:hypothetical protein n=1 Tax=Streptomyces sp. NPDC050535 TaxID=3365626 RepID=UPI0037A0A3E8
MAGEGSNTSATAPQYRRFSATETRDPQTRRRSSAVTPTNEYAQGPKPPKRHNTLFEIEEQPIRGAAETHQFAARQRENGDWAIQRFAKDTQKWVSENKGHWYDMALGVAKFIGPVAPEVTQGVGKLAQSAGFTTTGSLITGGGALARAAVDGKKLWDNYPNQDGYQTAAQVSGVVGGLLNAAGQTPWPSSDQQKALEGAGMIGTGGSFAGSMNPPQFQQPNYDLNTQINPAFDPFLSPGELDSPTHGRDSYFPPTTLAERMSATTITSPAVTSGAYYGSAYTATAPAVTSGADYGSMYSTSSPTMDNPAVSRSYTMSDAVMSGGSGYGAGSYLPNESFNNRQQDYYDPASESDTERKKPKGKKR